MNDLERRVTKLEAGRRLIGAVDEVWAEVLRDRAALIRETEQSPPSSTAGRNRWREEQETARRVTSLLL